METYFRYVWNNHEFITPQRCSLCSDESEHNFTQGFHVFRSRSRRVSVLLSAALTSSRATSFGACRKENSRLISPIELSRSHSIWSSKEEERDKVGDPTVTISSPSSSIIDSREHVDLVVIELVALDLAFTLLHQLCSDSLTLSAIIAFLQLDPIFIKKKKI